METIEKVLTLEEKNERIVARYKSFLKRRNEELNKAVVDPDRKRRSAEATKRLLEQIKEKGPFVTAIPPKPERDESDIQIHYRFERIV